MAYLQVEKLDQIKTDPTFLTLPSQMDDSISQIEMLQKLLWNVNQLILNFGKYADAINENTGEVEHITAQVEEIEKTITDTIRRLLPETIEQIASFVSFGLSSDGYFVVYIPEEWDFLRFGTIMDFDSPDFGKLTITYTAEG